MNDNENNTTEPKESGQKKEKNSLLNTLLAKKTLKGVAKEAVKKKLLILIATGGGIGGVVIFILLMVISVFVALGLIKSTSVSNGGAIASGGTTYLECKSINVDGKMYSLEDYVAGVITGEAYLDEGEEALKAQAIAARSYVIANTNNCTQKVTSSDSFQMFSENYSDVAKKAAEDTQGLVLTYNDKVISANFDSFCYDDLDCPDSKKNEDGSYTVTYTKVPNNETHEITLKDEKQILRIVPNGGHARGMSQLLSYQMAAEGKTYEEILEFFYSDGVKISKLEKSKTGTVNNIDPNDKGYSTVYTSSSGIKYKEYKQSNGYYTSIHYSQGNIASSGCGPTSAAIVASGYGSEHDPGTLVNAAYQKYNTNYFLASPDATGKMLTTADIPYIFDNTLTKEEFKGHLRTGKPVVVSVNTACGNYFTNASHYMAILDYGENEVFISNPNPAKLGGWVEVDKIFGCIQWAFLIN